MLHHKLKNIQDHGFPPAAYQAFIDSVKSIRKVQRQYFQDWTNKLDFDDSRSEAILEALKFINQKLQEDEKSKNWPKKRWYKHIMRRVQNAILEYSKYVYLPVVVPRPLRFSLKKYADSLKIVNRYVKARRDVTHSDEYFVIYVKGCDLLKKPCKQCELNYEICPIGEFSANDRKELNQLLRGERESLEFYAKWYRKTFEEWIRTLETLRSYAVSSHIPEIPILFDFDGFVDLKRFRRILNNLHPDLYDIYCSSLESTNLGDLDENVIISPRGWDNKTIKDNYNLNSQQLRELLISGDRVLNQFRANEGLRDISRDFQEKSLVENAV